MPNVNSNFTPIADNLGMVRAQIAELKNTEKGLREAFLATGEDVIEADLFRAVKVVQNRSDIDWKAIAKKLKPSRQLIQAHTTSQEVISIKTSSRRGDK